MTALLGLQIPLEVVVLGLITGLTYSLLAVGLVLAYKSSRIINFAQGDMGALPASILPILVISHGWGYWPAALAALAAGAATGAFMELVVVRKFARTSRLIALVATIGASQLFFAVEALIPKGSHLGAALFPVPFHASVTVGSLHLSSGDLLILATVPVVTAALALFLALTRIGLAARCAADNPDAARLTGIPVARISLVVWIIVGLLAALAAVLVGPTRPIVTQTALGPDLLVRGLAAAMIGGLTSLPQAFAGGVAVGIIEAVVRWNYPTGGTLDVVLLLLIIACFLGRRDLGSLVRGGEGATRSLSGTLRALPAAVAASKRVRWARWLLLGGGAMVAALVGLPATNAQRVLLASIVLFAAIGLSLVVLTGFAGQVSLGQFAFVEIGALVGGRMVQLGYPSWMGLLYATVAGAVVALVIGIPALRIRGLFLAVVTLAFAVASQNWLFGQPWLVHVAGASTSLRINRPVWLGIDLSGELRYYWLSLGVFALLAAVTWRIRATGLGRSMVAVRDNEPSAAAMGVSPRRVKLSAFVIAGAMAAFAGWFYGGLLINFPTSNQFSAELSLALVGMVIVGGITTITGALLGAVFLQGLGYVLGPILPSLLGGSVAFLIAGVGLLGAVLSFPNGIAEVAFAFRDRLVVLLDAGAPPPDPPAGEPGEVRPAVRLTPRLGTPGAPDTVLAGHGLTIRFGGNAAVDGVDLEVRRGEIVGLVGPNGAGKTTLFDLLSGHVSPDSGRVELFGADVTRLRPERRAALGLGRTFQSARLFEELAVADAVKVALERTEPSEAVPSILGLAPSRRSEARKQVRADELVDLMGLGRYASMRIAELSTGTRRMVELAAMVALGSSVLLLDEPTAGIAQREVEAFRPVLLDIRSHLDASLVIVEHDIPLIAGLVDRVYVLNAGQVLAAGPPAILRDDPRVAAAYLGSDERMIARSGALDRVPVGVLPTGGVENGP